MGRATKLKHIQIYLPDGAREVVNQRAKEKKHVVTADYVRELIEQDLLTSGRVISLKVQRGKKKKM